MTPQSEPRLNEERVPYEPPAIIYEGELTTRAGSQQIGAPLDFEVDPAKLFGNVD